MIDVAGAIAPKKCYIHGEDATWWERQPGSRDLVCGKCHP